MQGFEQGVLEQVGSGRGTVAVIGAALLGAGVGGEAVVQAAQQLLAKRRRRGPVDQGLRVQHRQSRLGHARQRVAHGVRAQDAGGVGVQRVQEQAAGRGIGAALRRVRREHGVHGADGQGIGAGRAGGDRQVVQRAEIAKAVRGLGWVGGRAPQAVDLYGQAPGAGVLRLQQFIQRRRARRAHGKSHHPGLRVQGVVAGGGWRAQGRGGVLSRRGAAGEGRPEGRFDAIGARAVGRQRHGLARQRDQHGGQVRARGHLGQAVAAVANVRLGISR
ncbi:hypothetical protein D3C72_1424300 [compost metagenome]